MSATLAEMLIREFINAQDEGWGDEVVEGDVATFLRLLRERGLDVVEVKK